MVEKHPQNSEVDQFILDEIESVPHLEALLLLWNSRPRQWPLHEMAQSLYISAEQTQPILRDLAKRGLITLESEFCCCQNAHPLDALLQEVDKVYRREVVRISTMIHSKPSPSVRAFARAFRLTKD